MKLSILLYHRVLAQPDPLFPEIPDSRRFRRQLRLLRCLFRLLPLAQAIELLKQGRLPARAACITFDDGYLDNLTVALPLLQQQGIPATFFIASDYLQGGIMWNDALIAAVRQARGPFMDLHCAGLGSEAIFGLRQRRSTIDRLLSACKYLPLARRNALVQTLAPLDLASPMLSPAQLRQLYAAGMDIGAHTASHPILQNLPDQLALHEIRRGRIALQEIIQQEVCLFAYPNGKPGQDYDQRHVQMVQALGFQAACSTRPACASASDGLYELPRYTPWQADRPRFALELVRSRIFRPC